MKFSLKLFLWTISIVAATLAVGGYYIVNSMFQTSLARETKQVMDESGIIRFGFEISALNIPYKYEHLQDQDIARIAQRLDTGGENRYVRICGEDSAPLYASEGFPAGSVSMKGDMDQGFEDDGSTKELAYRIIPIDRRYYIQTAATLGIIDRSLSLETLTDITNVFMERESGFSIYRRVCIVILICVGIIIFMSSYWLTRPVRFLSAAAKKMAKGNYGARAKKISSDELGSLTQDFNEMAMSLEENVYQLQEAARAQEEFVGVFAHELKTPLTAIIGYADMMRSQKLEEEKLLLSADYIYQEGRRLEKLSFNLLDLIVLKRTEKPSGTFVTKTIFEYIRDTFSKLDIILRIQYEEREVYGEMSLIKTMVANLVDNAVKVSEPSGLVEVTGIAADGRYTFTIHDCGCGIPPEHLSRLTEAFYMVDKSRSRSRHGAGLGLTLCAEIARLHGTDLKIGSVVGMGTTVSFNLEVLNNE
ncbi:sensor histidine kinase [Lacrimispora defluvii]|uniref:histidine kinase n=1 Tax=Lacrimispora defluvii TaxID=2719233 RepID=A0ABX1VTS6_9FIRM|nr:HAMP domain-containing sensor histidine kinase [Lacrimispora defluvii]NNJ31766.1 HAMP domain-containing histidine kinase [Lacrimispora defluvii]